MSKDNFQPNLHCLVQFNLVPNTLEYVNLSDYQDQTLFSTAFPEKKDLLSQKGRWLFAIFFAIFLYLGSCTPITHTSDIFSVHSNVIQKHVEIASEDNSYEMYASKNFSATSCKGISQNKKHSITRQIKWKSQMINLVGNGFKDASLLSFIILQGLCDLDPSDLC